jgi:hypothetical protein
MQAKYIRKMIKDCKENNIKQDDILKELDYRFGGIGSKNDFFNRYSITDISTLNF